MKPLELTDQEFLLVARLVDSEWSALDRERRAAALWRHRELIDQQRELEALQTKMARL